MNITQNIDDIAMMMMIIMIIKMTIIQVINLKMIR